MKPCPETIAKFFAESQTKFNAICKHLGEGQVLNLSEIEDYIWVEGNELLRQIQQNCLDLRSAQEEPAEKVIGPDLVERKPSGSRRPKGLRMATAPLS